MSDKPEMAKVLFSVLDSDGTPDVETLWATPLGDDQYRLDNSPFFAYSVSWLDIVYAPYDPETKYPTFQRVIRKSGHRTIRVVFPESPAAGSAAPDILKQLEALGCSYEGANPAYVCVDIPPEVDLETVREFMIRRSLMFEHADPTYAELFPEESA